MSRASRGCLRCRQRRVKCDEDRPSCKRCVARNEECMGYREESILLFRSENEKAARKVVRRRASIENERRPTHPSSGKSSITLSVAPTPPGSNTSVQAPSLFVSGISSPLDGGVSITEDPTDLSASLAYSLNLSNPYPWAKNPPPSLKPSVEDQVVDQFFEKYVMYPCNNTSSPGFLEHLPALVKEGNYVKGRIALRWAVRAASYASLSNERNSPDLGNKALQCYGSALSALGEALSDPYKQPDDYDLMTIVVLDIFETVHLGDQNSRGSHAEGMASILRLRGKDQIYGSRGWSLFRLSHHRLQRQQLAFKQKPLLESEAWLESLNESVPEVRIEKQNHQISKICERARELLKKIDKANLPLEETIEMMKEINTLDQASTTWRHNPAWTFKTLHRSKLTQDETFLSKWPEQIQLHRDVWIAYEWNYHRTARIIMHEHLLECLDRLHSLCSGDQASLRPVLCSFEETSITIIKGLVDEILSTVPQSLGEVDYEGNLLRDLPGTKSCKAIGGYFLLWPIRVIKSTRSAISQKRMESEEVFERIRECTGMKSVLGDASKI